MRLFKVLGTKTWLYQGEGASLAAGDVGSFALPPQVIALRTFLGVVGVLFGLFITAYFIRMDLDDWRPMPEPRLLWVNTGVLFICSVVLQWTRTAVTREDHKKVVLGLLLGGLLTLLFIAGQLKAWQLMVNAGFFLTSNPANSFFYVLTGLHGLHVLGGLWVWSRSTLRVLLGGEIKSVQLSVELCAVYWHFLLLVWLVLFALLTYT